MIRKLNRKGITTIEILICFVLLAVISTSLYNTVSIYRNKQILEREKEKIYTYKNLLTKEIQDDIVKKGLKNILKDSSAAATEITLKFNDDTDAILNVDVDGNKISYDGVDYPLPDFGKNNDGEKVLRIVSPLVRPYFKLYVQKEGDYSETEWLSDFSGSLYDSNNKLSDDSIRAVAEVLKIDIVFEHPDFGNRYGIRIVAPLRYTS